MPVVDENFKNAGKKPGIEIWRINQFKVEPVPKSQYGFFYSGDSYIVLSTKPSSEWDVHYWLGSETSQTTSVENAEVVQFTFNVHYLIGKDSSRDEYGTAAMKAVELDNLLGGIPIQYRELQEGESPLFLSYFKSGIKYLKGGYESGFHIVSRTEKWNPRLFQCKGKRVVRCKQVDCSRDSLNMGDVYILDNRDDIYIWCPPESGRLERQKGIEIATSIRDEYWCGQSNIHVLDLDWNSHESFWRFVGGRGPVKSAAAGGVDKGHWIKEKTRITLQKVSDASGKMETSKVAEGTVTLAMLDSSDAFILDAATGGVYVWVGKNCTMNERKKAMQFAEEYLEKNNLPKSTQVVRVLETAEPTIFLQWFSESKANKNVGTLATWPPRLYECSDETGRLTVLEICDFTQKDLDGDDVMILDSRDIIFLWIGHAANENEKKAAQERAKQFLSNDALPRPPNAKILTNLEGKETPEFIKCFKNWDPNFFKKKQTFEDMKRQVATGKK